MQLKSSSLLLCLKEQCLHLIVDKKLQWGLHLWWSLASASAPVGLSVRTTLQNFPEEEILQGVSKKNYFSPIRCFSLSFSFLSPSLNCSFISDGALERWMHLLLTQFVVLDTCSAFFPFLARMWLIYLFFYFPFESGLFQKDVERNIKTKHLTFDNIFKEKIFKKKCILICRYKFSSNSNKKCDNTFITCIKCISLKK